jgi:hypothetical protein
MIVPVKKTGYSVTFFGDFGYGVTVGYGVSFYAETGYSRFNLILEVKAVSLFFAKSERYIFCIVSHRTGLKPVMKPRCQMLPIAGRIIENKQTVNQHHL